MHPPPTFDEQLSTIRSADRRRRAIEGGVRAVAGVVVALALSSWTGGPVAAAVGIVGVSGVVAHTRRRTPTHEDLLARAPDADGLLITAWAVASGRALGDEALAARVLHRGRRRLADVAHRLHKPLSWPWAATVLAALALTLVPLPSVTPERGHPRQQADHDPGSSDVSPLSRTLMGGLVARLSSDTPDRRRGGARAGAEGTASSARDGQLQAGVAVAGGPGAPSTGEGRGKASGTAGRASSTASASGRSRTSDGALLGETDAERLRRVGARDGVGRGDEVAERAPEVRGPGGEPTAQRGMGVDGQDQGASRPLRAHVGSSDGRLADEVDDLDDLRIDEGQMGPGKEEISRESSSGRAGAMGSNDAPGVDDTLADRALAEAELAREWVEGRLRASPEGVIREVAEGRTGQRSAVGYRDLLRNYEAVAEAALADATIPDARRRLVRAYFDALQEESHGPRDDR